MEIVKYAPANRGQGHARRRWAAGAANAAQADLLIITLGCKHAVSAAAIDSGCAWNDSTALLPSDGVAPSRRIRQPLPITSPS